jgi:hypothetical protein
MMDLPREISSYIILFTAFTSLLQYLMWIDADAVVIDDSVRVEGERSSPSPFPSHAAPIDRIYSLLHLSL